MSTFVTGGTGLLGAQLLLDLSERGRKIKALRRKTSSNYVLHLVFGQKRDLLQSIEWVEGDMTDPIFISEALKGITEVYHCAAAVSFQASERNKILKENVQGTANMVNFSMDAGVKKFCHVSSVAALGREENVTIDENTFWKTSKNNSVYAISKYSSEREVWRGIEEGLNAVIVNPSIIIGPGDWKSGSSQMFSQVWKGLMFYTNGVGGFVDVHDVTKCMIELMDRSVFGKRFILSSQSLSYREIINMIADALHKKRPTVHANKFLGALAWRGELVRKIFTGNKPLITKETVRNSHLKWFLMNDKIKKELGMEFVPVKEAVERTAKIFLREKNQ